MSQKTRPRSLLFLPDRARGMGVRIAGGRGSGKSRFLGRILVWSDFLRGIPTIVIDPMGTVADHILDKLTRLPKDQQERLWPRLRYFNMAGTRTHVVPWPLYVRRPGETLATVAERPLTIWRRLDPGLDDAAIMGSNALLKIGKPVGVILAGLGYQVSEAADLIRNTESWWDRLMQVERCEPEAAPAVQFLREEVLPFTAKERLGRYGTFLNKVADFALDPTMRAMYGAAQPAVGWQEVIDRRLVVIFDFQHLTSELRTRFMLMALFQGLLDFVRHRGRAGRVRPVSLVIDELTALTGRRTAQKEAIAQDLQELISRLSRNNGVWLCACHQELNQFGGALQDVMMTFGTHLFGGMSDPDGATVVAKRFTRHDPSLIRGIDARGRVDEYSASEQLRLAAERLLDLPRFHFLGAIAQEEGTLPRRLVPFSIEHVDAGQYVNEPIVERARALLMQRDGLPIERVLSQIAARQPASSTKASAPARAPRAVSIVRRGTMTEEDGSSIE